MKLRIDVILQHADSFALQDEFLMYKPEVEPAGATLNLRLTDSVKEVRDAVLTRFGDAQVYEIRKTQTAFLSIERNLDALEDNATLKDAGVSHKSTWLVVPRENAALDAGLCWVGQDCEPIDIQVKVMDEQVQITVIKAWTLLRFQEIIFERTGIDPTSQRIQACISGVFQDLNMSDRDKTFAELKVTHNAKITVTVKDNFPSLSDTAIVLESERRNAEDVSILVYDELDPEKVIKHCKS